MPNQIVDAERPDRRAAAQTERYDRGMAIAAIVQAIPWFVWAAPVVLLFGFIIMALLQNRQGHALQDFTSGALAWLARLLIAGGIVLLIIGLWKCYRMYRQFMIDAATERTARANSRKAIAGARNAELKNELLEADIRLRQQVPNIILMLTQTGVSFKYDAKGNLEVLGQAGRTMINQVPGGAESARLGAGGAAGLLGPGSSGGLPTMVMYEEVRGRVPKGHVLVGVGIADVVTKEWGVGACIWIVGLSGTGKTSTTVIRVEERCTAGYGLLGVDPHWFKEDSLYHAIYETVDGEPGPYKNAFVKPMACEPKAMKAVLQYFLDEFYGRKSGKIPRSKWQPLTLLVDEVGSLMDAASPEEEEIKRMLPTIARICGQEARNFYMGGIFISQQATGLAWLRKVALMVIVHQLLMESEKQLACNGDKTVMDDMKIWPVGRTYVYGVGFNQTGPVTVQQPYFAGRAAPASGYVSEEEEVEDARFVEEGELDAAMEQYGREVEPEQESPAPAPVPALAGDMRRVYEACAQLATLGERVSSRAVERLTGIDKDRANGMMNELERMGYIQRRKAV